MHRPATLLKYFLIVSMVLSTFYFLVRLITIKQQVFKDENLNVGKILGYMIYDIARNSGKFEIVEINGDFSEYESYIDKREGTRKEFTRLIKLNCPLIPNTLIGQFKPDLRVLSEDEVEAALSSQNISLGGKWSPTHCTPQHHIAIIIPYRNRYEHLKQFLVNMHPLFARQLLSYGLYLIEPVENVTFNRGLLFNIGFIESNKDHKWQCHSYHDVDLLSEDDRTLYACYDQPMHMAHRINVFNYEPIYSTSFGGVTLLTRQQYEKCNGYSNLYFGWGGEDDDHFDRLIQTNQKIIAPPRQFNHYFMANHPKDKPNQNRLSILYNNRDKHKTNGVNSVKYKVVKTTEHKLYTKIHVTYDHNQ